MPPNFASSLIISATGFIGRTFLRYGTKELKVEGLPILTNALREGNMEVVPSSRDKGKGRAVQSSAVDASENTALVPVKRRRGIVTICNHNSVMDDPFAWGVLPASTQWPRAGFKTTSRNARWTLGARDIMFTNPFFSKFFDLGQVINTERGGGVFQPAVDQAVKLLQDGEWIHIFPEGKVNQRYSHPEGGLIRFKWGIGRIVMDSEIMPDIIPMWISGKWTSGFDQIMPERRGWPKFLPRTGAKVSVTFGESLTPRIQPLVDAWREIASKERGTVGLGGEWAKRGDSPEGEEQRTIRSRGVLAGGKEEEMRKRITSALQDGLRELGEAVERKEGRFERKEWSHSRAGVNL